MAALQAPVATVIENIYTDCEGLNNLGIGGVKSNPLQPTGCVDISHGQKVSQVTRGNKGKFPFKIHIIVYCCPYHIYSKKSRLWVTLGPLVCVRLRSTNTIPMG